MSQSDVTQMISRIADADFSAKSFLFVKLTPSDGISISGAGAACNGILQNDKVVAGKTTSMAITGTSKLVVDGSGTPIVEGDYLKSDALGKGIKTVVDNDIVGAIAMEPSTAAGDIIEVIIINSQRF